MAPLIDNLAKMAESVRASADEAYTELEGLTGKVGGISSNAESLKNSLDALTTILEAPQADTTARDGPARDYPAGQIVDMRVPRSTPHRNGAAKATKGKAGARDQMLGVLAEFERLGIATMDRRNLAVLSGQSPKSSTWLTAIGNAVKEGDIDATGPGEVRLSAQGRAKAPRIEPIRSLRELHDRWASKLPERQAEMMRAIVAARPKTISREEWAARSNQSITSSSFLTAAGRLVKMGVADTDGPGKVKAGSVLFPAGLR
jgi:hypothetical protein